MMRIAEAPRSAGHPGSAIGLYRRAGADQPDRPEQRIGLGGVLAEAGAFNEAIAAYNDALKLAPANLEALRGLANALLQSDRPQMAVTPLAQALAQDPSDARLYNALGVIADLAGDHQGAQARYRQGLGITPENMALANNLALSLALTEDYPAAISLLESLSTVTNSAAT